MEVVICIGIGVLLLLLLPALISPVSDARIGARKVQCSINLHQLGLALEQYCSDKNYGRFPFAPLGPAGDGPAQRAREFGLLYDYGKGFASDLKLFRCPSDASYVALSAGGTVAADAECSYGLSRPSSVTVPTNHVVAADQSQRDGNGNALPLGNANHADGQNLLYADWHVKFSRTAGATPAEPGGIYAQDPACPADTWIE